MGDTSDEQGGPLHQDIAKIENQYRGFWDEGMISEYCLTLKHETDPKKYKRLSSLLIYTFQFNKRLSMVKNTKIMNLLSISKTGTNFKKRAADLV